MTRVLFVHGVGPQSGRSQKARAAASQELASDWIDALSKGAPASVRADLAEKVRVVWYRDWGWVERQTQGALDEASDYMDELAHLMLTHATGARDPELAKFGRQGLAQIENQPEVVDAQGPMRAVRRAAHVLANTRLFGSGAFKLAAHLQLMHLHQVDSFVNDNDGAKAAIVGRFEQTVGENTSPLVVVAHSLGSIVAYEAIHQLDLQVKLFVTIGSPLGVPKLIYDKLTPQAGFPRQVASWWNFADPDDVVAARSNLEGLFPGDAGRLTNRIVHNEGRFAWHNATSYLTQDELRRVVWDALS